MTLDQQNIIAIKRQREGDASIQTNAVNFNYILKTGKVPAATYDTTPKHSFGLHWADLANAEGRVIDWIIGKDNTPFQDYHIDWKSNDAFTRALKTIENNAAQHVTQSPELQKLLQKDHWSQRDRAGWEEGVSKIVTEETVRIPGFAHYRTSINYAGASPDTSTNAKDITRLNDLSSDIEQNTETLRFDCGVQSIIKGVVIQNLENNHKFLPLQASGKDFKKASSYFYASGGESDGSRSNIVAHASIFTPSGNTIEATVSDPAGAYIKSKYGDSTLERMARGSAFYGTDGSIYNQPVVKGPSTSQGGPPNKKEHGEDYTASTIFSRDDLKKMAGDSITVTDADKRGLIMLASEKERNGQILYEAKLYQRQMQGTPQEGYVMVAYDGAYRKSGSPPPTLSKDYVDNLSGQSYKMTAEFRAGNVKAQVLERAQVAGNTLFEVAIAKSDRPITPAKPATSVFELVQDPLSPKIFNKVAQGIEVKNPGIVTRTYGDPVSKQTRDTSLVIASPVARDVKPDIKLIQTEMKNQGLYNGRVDGIWGAKTNGAFNDFMAETQIKGKLDGTYTGKIDKIYGPLTHASLQKNGTGEAAVGAIERLNKDQALATLYKREDARTTSPLPEVKNPVAVPDINQLFLDAAHPEASPASSPELKRPTPVIAPGVQA